MPSDPSGRRPIGVLSKSPPDWFDDNMAVAGGTAINFAGGFFFDVFSLYNNSQGTTAVLKVYGIAISCDSDVGSLAYSIQGTFGSFFGNPSNIRFDLPQPVGQVFLNSFTVAGGTTPPPFTLPPPIGSFGNPGFTGGTYFSPWPIYIVPPGYSLVISPALSSSHTTAFMWYQVASE